ncbi:MAG: hypothetical protein IT379_31485, partial [Deltaproteobacteria bacterium]|nr:hypothetical protein [Deltaproteobacteria bacterium]
AALPPGVWWIAWVRDMSYATAALARMGHAAEAAAAVAFFDGAGSNGYREHVGVDYHVSITRYFGDGSEETDFNEHGPNIEYDGFGLSTWAAHEAGSAALDDNADTLLALLDPETGLVQADSSIWEVHWNGQEKRFAYTSIFGARGLCDAGRTTEARALRDAILEHLAAPSGGIAQSLEELRSGVGAHDAAVVEAINLGLVSPEGAVAAAIASDLDAELRVPSGHGFFRNDDGGAYDRQEWVFVDLRFAEALHRMGRTAEAEALLGWITDQALLNYGLIPELMHRDTAGYQGSVPMVGFGAGAYILALAARSAPGRYEADPACFADTGSGSSPLLDAPADADGSSAGGCSAVGGDSALGWWTLLVLAFVPRARRRRPRKLGTSRPSPCLSPRCGERGRASMDPGTELRAIVLLVFGLLGVAACGDDDAPADGGGPDGRVERDGAVGPDGEIPDGGLPDVMRPDGALDDDARVPPPTPLGSLPRRDCRTRFALPLGRSGATVSVAGEWSGFDPALHAMSDGFFSGTYETSVLVPPGSWGYKLVVDGDWRFDPGASTSRYVDGTENSRIDVGDCRRPLLRVDAWDATPDDGTIVLAIGYVDSADGRGADPDGFTITMNRAPLPAGAEVSFDAESARLSVVVRGLPLGKYTFGFEARDASGTTTERPLLVPMWVEPEPFEWSDGLLYFVFTDRFRNGDPGNDAPLPDLLPQTNYHGGDLAGVLAAMREGYFDALGVRSIWLSPVNDNTDNPGGGSDGRMYSGYHGYWPSSGRAVESRFGSLDDLRALTAEAHSRGIRILLDLVQNQVHRDHPYVSEHPEWFNGDGSCTCGSAMCPWEERPLDCWFTSYLPDVNWTNMQAVDQMIDDAMFWLTEADVDGFRVDAVKHMQFVASTALRTRIRDTLETGNTRYYLVGETFTGSDGRDLVQRYVGDNALHAQFDFPLFWSIVGAFAHDGGTLTDLDNAVRAGESVYSSRVMSPFLGNHDVERFMSRAAGQLFGDSREQGFDDPPGQPTDALPYQRMALAFSFLLTQPGVPLVYYGDDVGLPGAGDPDNRRDMQFGDALSPQQATLLAHVRAVGTARATHPGLRRGARTTLHTDGDGYVFARGAARDVAIVALNRGSTERSVRVGLPPALGVPDGTVLRDLLGAAADVTVGGGGIDVPLPARGSAIYVVR